MGFDYTKLEALRLQSKDILKDQVASLKYFAYEYGFQHIVDDSKIKKISVSSTATCVLSLVATDKWRTDKPQTRALLKFLLPIKTSSKLEEDNPFTTAWILEAVTALEKGFSDPLDNEDIAEITRKEGILQTEIDKGNGGVCMGPYPPSAYLTQLVVRTLDKREKLTDTLKKAVYDWAWSELAKQLALIEAKSKAQDAFAVAYLVILVANLTPRSTISPEQSSILRFALKTFFRCQMKDGTWPLSRPLFHYPAFGNAYCYEYEMLTQLLQEDQIVDLLLEYLPNIRHAVKSVSNNVYRLGAGIRAWLSGHHPQLGKPESWATASVYHFFHVLDRVLAEAVRRELFKYIEKPLPSPGPPQFQEADFAKNTLDCYLHPGTESLKKFLWKEFVQPISAEADGVVRGVPFKVSTPRSAIFFGPPGTSKTKLAEEIAKFLGWPYLPIDPSLLLRNGMEGIQSEANTIFRMLEQTEGVVVLFDEFDELVRERESSRAEQPFSRLLTTAMLPKLASIHKLGTLVFLIATNNIAEFDLAISRQGRFDRVVQIMPPTYDAKMAYQNWGPDENLNIEAKFQELGVKINKKIKMCLEDLTFSECNSFAADLLDLSNPKAAINALNKHWKYCTLQRLVPKTHASKEEESTWKKRCQAEQGFITR